MAGTGPPVRPRSRSRGCAALQGSAIEPDWEFRGLNLRPRSDPPALMPRDRHHAAGLRSIVGRRAWIADPRKPAAGRRHRVPGLGEVGANLFDRRPIDFGGASGLLAGVGDGQRSPPSRPKLKPWRRRFAHDRRLRSCEAAASVLVGRCGLHLVERLIRRNRDRSEGEWLRATTPGGGWSTLTQLATASPEEPPADRHQREVNQRALCHALVSDVEPRPGASCPHPIAPAGTRNRIRDRRRTRERPSRSRRRCGERGRRRFPSNTAGLGGASPVQLPQPGCSGRASRGRAFKHRPPSNRLFGASAPRFATDDRGRPACASVPAALHRRLENACTRRMLLHAAANT